MTPTADIAVIGAGPAGLAAALAMARRGLAVTIVAPPYDAARAAADRRTTALIGPSVDLLKNLDAWDRCAAEAAPLAAVRIADDREALVRAPEVTFDAAELGLESFGANIPNPALLAALNEAADASPRLTRIATSAVLAIEPGNSDVRLKLAEGGSATARLAVAADGRNSIAPKAASVTVRTWTYPQTAIVTSFGHTRPHNDTVNELHRRTGPLTTVPLPGRRSSLVWVEDPSEAHRIVDLTGEAFGELLEERLQGVLGTLHDLGPRLLYPLSGASADRMGARRIALVGEAAHVIPPLGAQGLNLGLKDAAALADCTAEAQTRGDDIGGAHVLAAYHRARGADVTARSAAIDLLNRSLLTDFLPLDVVRGAAVHVMANSPALRRLLMRGGLRGAGPLPSLMRPNAPLAGS
ncbi:MAG: FAD-dependent oxidoreductase [Hyphomonadaceae bacterium]|nr:FAD-dependent oxidoreductase [Hyphomonadaceae bacterium]